MDCYIWSHRLQFQKSSLFSGTLKTDLSVNNYILDITNVLAVRTRALYKTTQKVF